MKTLRLLRNIAALFTFGAALVVLLPSAGQANGHYYCAKPSLPYSCHKVGGAV
jgi:hypothetical protein